MVKIRRLEQEESQHLAEIVQLRQELETLKQEKQDLQVVLSTIAEHGDTIEAQLYETTLKLQAEVIDRQRAQVMLQALLGIICKERNDLEIIVQTIMEHGDVVDTQWQQKLGEATLLATIDGLTKIANRRRFDEHLESQWHQMVREQEPLSIILCDIDCFKQYNDTYGHPMGDDCLKLVAQALNNTLSRPNDLVARYGGEEFAAILPQTKSSGALRVAERMQAAIARLKIAHAPSSALPWITLSIGVASTIPSLDRSPRSLLDEADQLLYRAKQQGRNRILHQSHTP